MDLADATMEFTRGVAGRISARRAALGLSKLAVAKKAGLDQRAITFVETGSRIPSIATLFQISVALETTVAELVSDTGGR